MASRPSPTAFTPLNGVAPVSTRRSRRSIPRSGGKIGDPSRPFGQDQLGATTATVRAEAGAVVIGGGVAGCSIAYHLARLGVTDVVVVEQHELTEGTTWHSAGFVGQLRSTISQTRMIMYSSSLYAGTARTHRTRPGLAGRGRPAAGHHRGPGRGAEPTGQLGHHVRPGDVAALAGRGGRPVAVAGCRDVLAAGWLPGDGFLRPEALARALAAGAAAMGVEFVTGTAVTGIDVVGGRVRGVRTDAGPIRADVVVNAAGAAAGHVGRLAGVDLPIVPIRHQYVVTAPLNAGSAPPQGLDTIPTVRDPDHIVYFRGEGDAILVGGYLRTPQAWWPAGRRRAVGARPGRCSSRTWRASPSRGPRSGDGCRRWRTRRSPRWCTVPRRSRPTASSCSARPRSAGSGSRPGSACTVSPPPAGSAR